MNKGMSSILSLLIVVGLIYFFRAPLKALISRTAPSGTPTPGYAAMSNAQANPMPSVGQFDPALIASGNSAASPIQQGGFLGSS